MGKNVYHFYEGHAGMRDLLGGKGANLAEMVQLQLPVPPGFTISTGACMAYLAGEQRLSARLKEEILTVYQELMTTAQAGAADELILLSVRSGSVFSMPGMMDTILNLGLNDQTVEQLAAKTGNRRFALDCYRRLLQMFGEVVYGISGERFEQYLAYVKVLEGVVLDYDLSIQGLEKVVAGYQEIYRETLRLEFPQDPQDQLFLAIEAVFRSWNNQRAVVYRNLHNLPHDLGTAVNIQQMVFGNSGETSGTGVLFTRNPATGERQIFGEFLVNAQGEDVVAGIRTPQPLAELAVILPEVYDELSGLAQKLETHYRDMQDIEFTIEHGRLYLLQTRGGKRTAQAAFQIAHDLVQEGLLTEGEALMRLEPELIEQLLHPVFSQGALAAGRLIATGLPASPGAASGRVVFDTLQAKAYVARGEKVILVRQETSPEDVEGMSISEAIVTSRGGMTSHAAVVARGMGTCCVAGCHELEVNEHLKTVRFEGGLLQEGDLISVNGSEGTIYLGALALEKTGESETFNTVMAWADQAATMAVRANAETVADLETALAFGATGVGLVRTEHMFFNGPRLSAMRQLILAEAQTVRLDALKTLLAFQIEDFKELFRATQERPVVIRLLDPPLHEFLPQTLESQQEVAQQLALNVTDLQQLVRDLTEVNPMLGHRGCRLGVTFPEIYQMQVEAIVAAGLALQAEGIQVAPEIMIPLGGVKAEFTFLEEHLKTKITALLEQKQGQLNYTLGTMIELPRACLVADEFASVADFFSFGTNDLTQLTYGYSRDDAGKFITAYRQKEILTFDPFQTLDTSGVGQLMALAVAKGRAVKPDLKIGVCGEVGGDPASIEFFQTLGLDYVSCSPYRVPVARLAVAQAALRTKNN